MNKMEYNKHLNGLKVKREKAKDEYSKVYYDEMIKSLKEEQILELI